MDEEKEVTESVNSIIIKFYLVQYDGVWTFF